MLTKNEILRRFFNHSIGIPYKWGGDDPINGYDCSGFVQDALSSIGIDPIGDQTAHALYEHFSDEKNGIRDVSDFGSLIFFGSPERITHVSMFVSQGVMIESSGGGRNTKTLQDAINQNACVKYSPIARRKDKVAIIFPKGLEE